MTDNDRDFADSPMLLLELIELELESYADICDAVPEAMAWLAEKIYNPN